MRTTSIILAFALLSVGCGKEEVDPTTLTSNPFDQDYTGAPIFELIGQHITSYVVDGQTRYRQQQDIRVRTDLMPSGATFTVMEVGISIPVGTNVASFSRVVDPVTPGNQYCKTYQLTNGGGHAAENAVCATATL